MQDFHELKVWQKAHELTLVVYPFLPTWLRVAGVMGQPNWRASAGTRKDPRANSNTTCSSPGIFTS